MSEALAALSGYVIGSLPTATTIAHLMGVDLLETGSGNPGTNNARRLGGYRLAAPVLLVELFKGAACVLVGQTIGGEVGAVIGGLGGIAGNVFNVWHGFRGGKGLAISAGVLLVLWPAALIAVLVTIVVALLMTRSTGLASLAAIAVLVILGFLWPGREWPNGWGIEDTGLLPYFAVIAAIILTPKHLIDATGKFRGVSRP
jgi:acyl phosphate:glycerol-3-phosphate acyltransferase